MDLRGIYPPIPTPFDANGELALAALRENLHRWSALPLRGVLALGSTGEFVLLNADEKLRVLETTRAALDAERLLLAGTGCPTTAESIDLTRRAAALGADAALLIHPHYYKSAMSDAALVAFFHDVAEASPVPVLVYNMPGCTGMDLSAELLIRIASHENIIGWKDSGANLAKMAEVVAHMGAQFQLLIGSASLLYDALAVGAVGGILALANIAPAECLELYEKFLAGRRDEAQASQLRLQPINQAVTARFGIAGLKIAMDALGLYGGPVRRPLLELTPAARAELLAILRDGNLRSLN
jgi:4-hydroxy-2-oxoglutarate aldolase